MDSPNPFYVRHQAERRQPPPPEPRTENERFAEYARKYAAEHYTTKSFDE